MSFKARVTLPQGVEVLRRYDRREIDGTTTKLSLFTPSPTPNEVDNNYVNNPLPGAKNHVVLGLSINATLQHIKGDATIDPVLIVNQLKDAVVKLDTNGGREERILHPLKDYMNFSQSSIVAAESFDSQTNTTNTSIIATLQATGPRIIDNLFYFEPNESFTLEVLFKTGVFPAQSAFSAQGRFGIEAELYLAQMNAAQLAEYDRRLMAAAG